MKFLLEWALFFGLIGFNSVMVVMVVFTGRVMPEYQYVYSVLLALTGIICSFLIAVLERAIFGWKWLHCARFRISGITGILWGIN